MLIKIKVRDLHMSLKIQGRYVSYHALDWFED